MLIRVQLHILKCVIFSVSFSCVVIHEKQAEEISVIIIFLLNPMQQFIVLKVVSKI